MECFDKSSWLFYKHEIVVATLAFFTYGLSWFFLEQMEVVSMVQIIAIFSCATLLFFIGAFYVINEELRKDVLAIFSGYRE